MASVPEIRIEVRVVLPAEQELGEVISAEILCGASRDFGDGVWACDLPDGHEGDHWGTREGRRSWADV